jgi:hypothetical protein
MFSFQKKTTARFTLENINNGALSFPKASPQKDLTSDGTSSFEMGRRTYIQMNALNKSVTPLVIAQQNHKKWLGGNNRDASQITANRRNRQIGQGSLNMPLVTGGKQPTLSYTTYKDIDNTRTDHLHRTRSGGSVAPPKCALRKNGIVQGFSPAVPAFNNQYTKKYPYLYH